MNRLTTIIFTLAACIFAALPFLYAQKQEPKPAPTPQNAAQIELLETKYRFETNGDSRKEVHARVRINNELGVRQFARLKFDYNRSFQSVEIPLVRVTHPSGGTADILPSAIADNPNPAVVDFPAYQDVREKSVRIFGLAPGDLLEYRVITTTTHPPLAPDFWLDHTFDRTGVVTEEHFELDAPGDSKVRTKFTTLQPANQITPAGRSIYTWEIKSGSKLPDQNRTSEPDIEVSTFASWAAVAGRISRLQSTGFGTTIYPQADALNPTPRKTDSPEFLYRLVSRRIKTVDLPLDFSNFVLRGSQQILSSGYGTPEEKARLLDVLLTQGGTKAEFALYGETRDIETRLPSPGPLTGALLEILEGSRHSFVSPGLEVAPYGALPSDVRGRRALRVTGASQPIGDSDFVIIPEALPFASSQNVRLAALVDETGTLSAKVRYQMRGDNELLLRVAFHQTPKEKWKDVAQLLALSDGFRGKVTKVTASDPYETIKPFEVEYDVEQPKFVNWEKKPVRIPAILPLVGLPDPPAPGAATIELGTPLDVDLQATITLPPGTTARVPTGTSVARDYATFSSSYSARGNILTASRKINFLLRSLAHERLLDYNAFLRAVQNDQAQDFTLENGPSSKVPNAATKAAVAQTAQP